LKAFAVKRNRKKDLNTDKYALKDTILVILYFTVYPHCVAADGVGGRAPAGEDGGPPVQGAQREAGAHQDLPLPQACLRTHLVRLYR
jgi:hypothetical protein